MNEHNDDAPARIKGVDVSHYNGVIDWKKVKEAGYQFAFLKATEGVDLVDETFAANRRGAREAGLSVGYYHFFRPNDSVDAQVTFFIRTIGRLELDALRPVLDVEDPRIWRHYTVQQRVAMIVDWCQKVKKSLGVTPMIYASPKFVEEILESAPELAAYDLWIANYNVPEPNVPKPWTKWIFWQNNDKGTVPGINGEVDMNLFNGSDISKSRSRDNDDVVDDEPGLLAKILFAGITILFFVGLIAVLADKFHN
jgi:lysozyme